MLKKFSTLGYAAALATAPAWLTACSTPPDAAPPAEEPTVLFSLSADSMHFENPSPENVTLVMDGVDPHSVWFTDRPTRESGAITTTQLAAEWGEGQTFNEDPPNAALVLHQPVDVDGGAAETLVVEMLDASYDEAKATFRAELKVLGDAEADALEGTMAAHGDRHDSAWPSEAGEVSLFIDSVTLCTSPSTCQTNKTENYNYNSTIYFTATIGENVT